MTNEQRVELWNAIARVVEASGGSNSRVTVERQLAVALVERVVADIEKTAAGRYQGALVELLDGIEVVREAEYGTEDSEAWCDFAKIVNSVKTRT